MFHTRSRQSTPTDLVTYAISDYQLSSETSPFITLKAIPIATASPTSPSAPAPRATSNPTRHIRFVSNVRRGFITYISTFFAHSSSRVAAAAPASAEMKITPAEPKSEAIFTPSGPANQRLKEKVSSVHHVRCTAKAHLFRRFRRHFRDPTAAPTPPGPCAPSTSWTSWTCEHTFSGLRFLILMVCFSGSCIHANSAPVLTLPLTGRAHTGHDWLFESQHKVSAPLPCYLGVDPRQSTQICDSDSLMVSVHARSLFRSFSFFVLNTPGYNMEECGWLHAAMTLVTYLAAANDRVGSTSTKSRTRERDVTVVCTQPCKLGVTAASSPPPFLIRRSDFLRGSLVHSKLVVAGRSPLQICSRLGNSQPDRPTVGVPPLKQPVRWSACRPTAGGVHSRSSLTDIMLLIQSLRLSF
jgi:hypothetical protein